MSGHDGQDMVGDDGYGTWDNKRLDQEYRKVKKQNRWLAEQLAAEHACWAPHAPTRDCRDKPVPCAECWREEAKVQTA